MRVAVGVACLIVGVALVVAAILLLLFADLPAAIAAAMAVPGLGLIATSGIIATARRAES
jgi:hypothetical protein